MEKIQFQPNVPVTLALRFGKPKEVQSQFGDGVQFFYSTVDGRGLYATPMLSDKIEGLGLAPREEFSITKGMKGNKVEWIVGRPGCTSDTAPPQRSSAPAATESYSQSNLYVPRLAMDRAVRMFLSIAADAVIEVEERTGRMVDAPIQALACTLFIESAKKGHIEFPAELAQQAIADQKLGELQRRPATSETSEFPPAAQAWKTRGEMKAVYAKVREALGEVEYFQRLAEFNVSDPGQFKTREKALQCYELLVGSIRRAA
jgi:hypothetical protein